MNSEFQKRLFQFQAKPPAKAWSEIAAALDEETPVFAGRLFRFQVLPAKGIWSKISARLGGTSAGLSRTIPGRNKWMAYAAAAVIVVLAGYGIYLMIPAGSNQAVTPASVAPVAIKPEPAAPATARAEEHAAT